METLWFNASLMAPGHRVMEGFQNAPTGRDREVGVGYVMEPDDLGSDSRSLIS